MKKTTLIITLAAVLGLVAVSCHDEPVVPTPGPVVRNVGYVACGNQHQTTVTGDDSWHSLLDTLFAAAEGGCRVTFWNPDAMGSKQADTVTISTADRREAYRWGEEMYDQGYIVSIVYDENTSTYRGTAVKSVSPPSDYTPIPLDDYLLGTRILDTSMLAYPDEANPNDINLFHMMYGLEYPYHESLFFSDSTVYISAYDTTCAYTIMGSDEINIALYDTLLSRFEAEYGFRDFQYSKIYQLSYDCMVIKGYFPTHAFHYLAVLGEAYVFHRQN